MSTFLTIQLLLLVALPLIIALSRLQAPGVAARTSRLLLLAAVTLPVVLPMLSVAPAWRPPAQVFSAPDGAATFTVPAAQLSATVPAAAQSSTAWLYVLVAAGLLVWTLLSIHGLHTLLTRTRLVRRIGRVEVRVGAPVCAALALPGRAIVLLDEATWATPDDRLLAVRHELQHHRQGDPRFAWVLQLLVVLCCLNPASWLLRRQLTALDELACDDALRRRVSVRAYCNALLRAARRSNAPLALAPGLTRRSLLNRRLMMLTQPRRAAALPLSILSLTAMAAAAHAAEGLLADGHLDAAEFATLAERVDSLDVPTEGLILDALNHQLESPKMRAFLDRGLDNRARYAGLVDGALLDNDMPAALAAVPLIESGYANLGAGEPGGSLAPGIPGKGVWMFIPQTARNYGLTVDGAVDERLDPAAETEAAMSLLSELHDEFGDWGLALAGYNQGAGHVRMAIKTEGTDDVWTLIESGALNGYVPQVYAAMVLMEAPELLR